MKVCGNEREGNVPDCLGSRTVCRVPLVGAGHRLNLICVSNALSKGVEDVKDCKLDQNFEKISNQSRLSFHAQDTTSDPDSRCPRSSLTRG